MKTDILLAPLSSAVTLALPLLFSLVTPASASTQPVPMEQAVATQQRFIGDHQSTRTAHATRIVVIDSEVADQQSLLGVVDREAEVIRLKAGPDALAQLSEALHGRTGIDAIHLISHGKPGVLMLGGDSIDVNALDGHGDELMRIGKALSEAGDILLYGCRVADGDLGVNFIRRLSELTGADVAASDDPTGALEQGGDWVLERSHGAVGSAIAFNAKVRDNYKHLLALPVIGGTASAQAVDDNTVITPFSAVTITDTDGHNVTTTVTLDTNAKGVFTSASLTASGFSGTGPYTLAATTPANAQAAIRQLSYDPTNDRVAPGATETTTFTINVDDATLNASDSTTTVISNSINDNPGFTGTPSISGTATVGAVLSAANTATTDTDTGDGITLSYQWKSNGVNIGGATAGSYTLTATEAHTTITLEVTGNDDFGGSTGLFTTAGVGVSNTAPVNTGLPAISGTATVGGALSTTDGSWTDADGDGLSYAYQWRDDGVDIAGATTASYTLTSSEAHSNITVQVTASDGNGGATPAVSAATAVANTAPVNTGLPVISGSATVGNALSTSDGAWSDADGDIPGYAYQWRSNGVDIAGATLASYTLTSNEAHTTITVQVTATDGNGGSTPATSTGTAVANTAPANSVLPSISGTATVGGALTVSDGTWTDADGDGLSYAYQWRADGVDIAGANTAGYTLSSSEAHASITVQVTATDGNGGSTPAITAGTPVANTAPVNTALPTISGTATVGNTLTASNGTWTDVDGDTLSYTYQWQANGVDIAGATNVSFIMTSSQAGSTLSVIVTADDGNGGSGSAGSLTLLGNSPPVISGSPATSVTGHTGYSFTPVASDADGDTLTFSIINAPVWGQFDSATGTLTGVPSNSDLGTTSGIIISVTDGVATVSLSAFNLIVTENPDIDGDGMPNDWEIANGLDPEDPNDAASDLDGDGIDNLNEYLSTLDPGSDDNPPALMLPADVTVTSIGLFTPVDTGQATAYDDLDGELTPTSDAAEYYAPGSHTVTWRVSDAAGNTRSGIQTVNVIPLVSFSMDQTTAEGSRVSFRIILNGAAANYPVSVPYVVAGSAAVDGSDHDLVDATAVISEGVETTISFDTVDDGPGEGTEQIVIAMDNPVNAAEGPVTTHTVDLVEGNVAPEVSLYALQGGEQTRIVVIGNGPVTVKSVLTDPNAGDNHGYDWSATDTGLSDTDAGVATYTFDPESLSPGIYTLRLDVNDGAESAQASLVLNLVDQAPSLTNSMDSDGDGVDDESEGISDKDNDGIPDFLDAISSSHVLQGQSAQSASHLLESEPGLRMTLGSVALLSQDGEASIDSGDLDSAGIDTDDGYEFSGGLFDFNVEELPVAGQSVSIVVPQLSAIPAAAVYRKLMPGGWQDFVVDDRNGLASALGAQGFCPPPGDLAYQRGLTEGHWCVQLTIEDGGPNDADGTANQAIDDPGGVAAKASSGESDASSGGGGGSTSAMLLLTLFLLSLLQLGTRRLCSA